MRYGSAQGDGIAIALLFTGGLTPLQTVSAAAGLPFSIVIIAMCISFIKSLRKEDVANLKKQEKKFATIEESNGRLNEIEKKASGNS